MDKYNKIIQNARYVHKDIHTDAQKAKKCFATIKM